MNTKSFKNLLSTLTSSNQPFSFDGHIVSFRATDRFIEHTMLDDVIDSGDTVECSSSLMIINDSTKHSLEVFF